MNAEPVFSKVKLRRKDEIKVLADSMSEMEESLSEYMHDLTDLTSKQERIEAELNVAENIQTGLLPKELEGYEGRGDFSISSYMKPAREVGGDFYDYFVIDDDHIGLVIADVSGKGVPAALFMAISKTIIKNAALEYPSPATIMETANRGLCLNNPETMFVTVWFGIYTISTHTVTYVNAGHEYPAVYRAETGAYELIEEEHDTVLGFVPDVEFHEHTITLNPGDRLFQYTDGVPEANGADEILFGTDRMLECLNSTSASDPGDAVFEALCSRIEEFTGGTEQYDDMTMLMLSV
jgi:sigma-B regulation protein RsbU (phosphoserine phosphatase)